MQHAVYCLRQAALIHLERLWEENRFTAEGQVLHVHADKPMGRSQRGVRRVTALALASRRWNIAGVADLVEFSAHDGVETALPVEFKRGKPKLHRADEVQLCAQGLCLEEMTGHSVPQGALYYAQTKPRVSVPFDAELRRLTETTIEALACVFAAGRTPPPTLKAERCRACSLLELCRPKHFGRLVRDWRRRMVALALSREPKTP
ncbi:MAG: CRISPR-associated protein Cas4 [Pseudomonadota bacterium]|nr:CRISPR-associated protein Cas4 [Pseudomonadota bacterium]